MATEVEYACKIFDSLLILLILLLTLFASNLSAPVMCNEILKTEYSSNTFVMECLTRRDFDFCKYSFSLSNSVNVAVVQKQHRLQRMSA